MDALCEVLGFLLEFLVGVGLCEDLECGCAGGHCDGVAGECSGLVHGSERCDVGHEFFAGAVCSDGESAADDFAEAGDVGLDVVEGLCAAVCDSESGDYFVEDEECAVVVRDFSESVQEFGVRWDDAHVSADGFDDDACDALRVGLEDVLYGLEVVVWSDDGVGGEFWVYACGVGDAGGGESGTGADE